MTLVISPTCFVVHHLYAYRLLPLSSSDRPKVVVGQILPLEVGMVVHAFFSGFEDVLSEAWIGVNASDHFHDLLASFHAENFFWEKVATVC